MGGWLAQAADLLSPLVALLPQGVLLGRVIHGADPGVKVRVNGSDRTGKAHLGAYIGAADFPYLVFDFPADWTAEGLLLSTRAWPVRGGCRNR